MSKNAFVTPQRNLAENLEGGKKTGRAAGTRSLSHRVP